MKTASKKTAAFILSLIVFGACLANAAPEKPETLKIGAIAPAFDLPGVDGKRYALSDFADAPALVIVFTCNHCPDARYSRGKIAALQRDYASRGVALVAISSNNEKGLNLRELGWSVYGDSFEEMKIVAEEEGYRYPYLYDGETQEVATAYGAVATPHVFVFDAERKLRYTGRIDDAKRNPKDVGPPYARQAIDAVLAGGDTPTPVTRAYGCSIKWIWKNGLVASRNEEWANLPVELETLDTQGAQALAANKTDSLRLVNLWSTTCGPCVAEFPELVNTYRRFQTRPFDLITISVDRMKDRSRVEKFLKAHEAAISPRRAQALEDEGRKTNNYLFSESNLDGLAEAVDETWSGALPHTALIAPGGEVIWRHTGELDFVELRRAIVKWMDADFL